jgi:hypothetical protein
MATARPNPPTKSKDIPEGLRAYTVRPGTGSIHHNGRPYDEGDEMLLSEVDAAPLAHLLTPAA